MTSFFFKIEAANLASRDTQITSQLYCFDILEKLNVISTIPVAELPSELHNFWSIWTKCSHIETYISPAIQLLDHTRNDHQLNWGNFTIKWICAVSVHNDPIKNGILGQLDLGLA